MRFLKVSNFTVFKKLLSVLFLISLCFIVVGCSENGMAEEDETETNSTDKQNKESIQAVIEKEFNGPDKKYRELWKAAMATQTTEMNQEEYEATLETPVYKEFIEYMEDVYSPYFTENAYDIFSRTVAFSYSFSEKEYKINTSNIKINQNEIEKTLYNFTFEVNYENEKGEENTYNFEGKAIVPEVGEIGKMEFNDKDGLQEQIR